MTTDRDALFQVTQSDAACFTLARGSSIVVATLMCLPDAIALIPAVPSPQVWFIRVIGLWLSAAILWTLGLFAFLKLAFAITGPIVIEKNGIRLSKLSKLIPWQRIAAVGVDSHDTVRRLFLMKNPVMRMMLYFPKYEEKGKWVKGSAQMVPSFWFTQEQFRTLVDYVSKKCFGIVPDGLPALVGLSPLLQETREVHQQKRGMRRFYSIVVAVGIVIVLGQKIVSNYAYNAGNAAMRQGRVEDAIESYRLCLSTKPAFAMGWHQLARAYWLKGNLEEAEKSWRNALRMRPDLVEAKVGLAAILIERKDYAAAQKLLDQAIRLSPTYSPAYIQSARLNVAIGDLARAKEATLFVIKLDPMNTDARALLDQLEKISEGGATR